MARDENFAGAHAQEKQALSDILFIRQNIVQLYLKQINAEARKKKQKKIKKWNGLPGQTSKKAKRNYPGLHKNIHWNIFINVLIDKAIIESLLKGV